MALRAVLFDFDGVIADTENIHVAAWQRTLSGLGWEASDELCMRAVEEDDRSFLTALFAERGIQGGDVAGWVRRKQALTRSMLADSPRVYPGFLPLVEALQGEIRLAVVSTTWRENIETVLNSARVADRFATIVGKEDVERVKPDPEAYQLALKRLELTPSEAVVIEDSRTGLAAAAGAGLRALAVGHRLKPGAWTGGAPYVANLVDTDDVLRALRSLVD